MGDIFLCVLEEEQVPIETFRVEILRFAVDVDWVGFHAQLLLETGRTLNNISPYFVDSL